MRNGSRFYAATRTSGSSRVPLDVVVQEFEGSTGKQARSISPFSRKPSNQLVLKKQWEKTLHWMPHSL